MGKWHKREKTQYTREQRGQPVPAGDQKAASIRQVSITKIDVKH